MDDPPSPYLLGRLRDATREAHDALERELDWRARVASLAGYRALLSRFYGFHSVWEPAAAVLLADDAFFEPRRKLQHLAADLRTLGLTDADMAGLPRAQFATAMTSRAEAMGALYVVEGSTLGGQVIARHIAETLGLGAERGCAYYRSYGRSTGTMWRQFRDRLLTVASDDHGDAVTTASRMFSALRAWLCADPRDLDHRETPPRHE